MTSGGVPGVVGEFSEAVVLIHEPQGDRGLRRLQLQLGVRRLVHESGQVIGCLHRIRITGHDGSIGYEVHGVLAGRGGGQRVQYLLSWPSCQRAQAITFNASSRTRSSRPCLSTMRARRIASSQRPAYAASIAVAKAVAPSSALVRGPRASPVSGSSSIEEPSVRCATKGTNGRPRAASDGNAPVSAVTIVRAARSSTISKSEKVPARVSTADSSPPRNSDSAWSIRPFGGCSASPGFLCREAPGGAQPRSTGTLAAPAR